MAYVQGFLVPVPVEKRDAYVAMAREVAPHFLRHGARRNVEGWGDDIVDGKRTDMKRAVAARADEHVVFAWVEWPDEATCEAAEAAMRDDPETQPPADLPFDAGRMVFAGFDVVHEAGGGGAIGYIDGIVARVPSGEAQAVAAFETAMEAFFLGHGATRMVSGFSSVIAASHTTDFLRAVDAAEGDAVTFGWVEWPDRATRDAGMAAMMGDERMAAIAPAFDGPTAIFGGFVPILDTGETR